MYRVAADHNSAECELPGRGDVAENDVWAEEVSILENGRVVYDYKLIIANGLPYWPESDVRRS